LGVDVGVVDLRKAHQRRLTFRNESPSHLGEELDFGRAKGVVDGKDDAEVEHAAFVDAIGLQQGRRGQRTEGGGRTTRWSDEQGPLRIRKDSVSFYNYRRISTVLLTDLSGPFVHRLVGLGAGRAS
jgi:hypothetical protein